MLHICLSAALYRPIEVHQAIVESADDCTPPRDIECSNEMNPTSDCQFLSKIPEDNISVVCTKSAKPSNNDLSHTPSMIHNVEDKCTDSTNVYYKENVSQRKPANADDECCAPLNDEKTKPDKCRKTGNCSKLCSIILSYIDLSLIKNPLFLLMAATVMLMAVGCPHALFYLPSYANSLGLDRNECSLLLSISAVFDLAGRVGLGYIADLNLFAKHHAYCAR